MSDRDESHSSLYLINKKLADLNKVVSIVEFNRVSLINGIDTIKERYHDELTNIFNDHANIMQNILDELQITRNKSEKDIENQYKVLFEELNLHLLSAQNALKDELLCNLAKINSEIKGISDFIQKISIELDDEITTLNNYDREKLGTCIQNAKDKMKDEFILIDKESKIKYNSLIENNKKQIKRLDDTFQKAVVDLKKKFFFTTKDQDFLNIVESFKSNSMNFLAYMDENKNNIFKYKNEYKVIFFNYHNQIMDSINEIIFMQQQFQKEIQEENINAEIELSKLNNFLSEIRNIQNIEKERLNEKLNKLTNDWTQEKKDIQNEIKIKTDSIKSNFEDYNEQIHKLEENLTSDFANLKMKYEKEEGEIYKKLDSLVFLPEKNPDDFSFRLKELRKMHCNEIDFFDKQNQMEILNENNDFNEKKNAIQSIINLESQKVQIKKDFEAELHEFDSDNETFFTELKNNLENDQIAEKNILEEKYSNFLSELDLKIKECNEGNRHKKFNRIAELENQRLSFMTNLKHEFKTDKVVDKFISKYHDEYMNLNEKFINFDDTLFQSQLTKNDIEKEKSKLDEKENQILNEKNEFLKKWKNLINNENDEHQKRLLNNKISNDDEINNKLNNELTDIRLEYMKRFKEKDILLAELQISLSELQKYEINLETPELDEKIKELKEELEKLKRECNEKISEVNDNEMQYYSPILNQIDEQKNKNFQDLQIEKRKIEIEISELAKNVNDSQSNLNEAIYEGNKQLNREMLAFQLNEQKMKNDHLKNVDYITNDIIQAKKELDDILNRNIEDELSQIEKNFSIAQNVAITQNKKEIDKLLSNKKSIEKQLNLEFKKINSRCQEAQNLYNSKEIRPEEQRIIDRLEGILELKSQSLTSSVKDMMSFRNRLQAQEELYNTRFGASPKIGIAMLKHRSSSQLAKNLPPL